MRLEIFGLLILLPALALADDLPGKGKSSTCVACHGPNGLSVNEQWPNLNSQKKEYLAAQLRSFRDGTRSNPLMSPVAKMLSDQDIADLAAYYAAGAP